MQRISSRRNPLVNQYRDVARGKNSNLLLLDGAHLVSAALAANIRVRHIVVSADALDRPDVRAIVDLIDTRQTAIAAAPASVVSAMSPVRQPSGVVAIAERPSWRDEDLFPSVAPLVVIAAEIQDPGNIGAITRVAEAGGANGVIAAGASADPFGWKALRGSMGSALRLPIAVQKNAYLAVDNARKHGCEVIAAMPNGGGALFAPPLTGAPAVFARSGGGGGGGRRGEHSDETPGRVLEPGGCSRAAGLRSVPSAAQGFHGRPLIAPFALSAHRAFRLIQWFNWSTWIRSSTSLDRGFRRPLRWPSACVPARSTSSSDRRNCWPRENGFGKPSRRTFSSQSSSGDHPEAERRGWPKSRLNRRS